MYCVSLCIRLDTGRGGSRQRLKDHVSNVAMYLMRWQSSRFQQYQEPKFVMVTGN